MISLSYLVEEYEVPIKRHRLTPSHWQYFHMPQPRFIQYNEEIYMRNHIDSMK